MEKNIALIYGDGIGPDVVTEGVNILNAVAKKFGHKFNYTKVIAGGEAIDARGEPLPKDQLDICLKSDAVLLGAVGGPKWDSVAPVGITRRDAGLCKSPSGSNVEAA